MNKLEKAGLCLMGFTILCSLFALEPTSLGAVVYQTLYVGGALLYIGSGS